MLTTYLLRNIDKALWTEFSERAAGEGRTLRGVLMLLIAHYVKHGMPRQRG